MKKIMIIDGGPRKNFNTAAIQGFQSDGSQEDACYIDLHDERQSGTGQGHIPVDGTH